MTMSIESALARESIREALGQTIPCCSMATAWPATRRTWADKLFTPDAVFISHYPDGTEQIRIEGREAIYKTFGRPGSPEVAGRHFMVNTVFDELFTDDGENADLRAHPGIEARSGLRKKKRDIERRRAGDLRNPRVPRHLGARRRRMEEEVEHPAERHVIIGRRTRIASRRPAWRAK